MIHKHEVPSLPKRKTIMEQAGYPIKHQRPDIAFVDVVN